MTKIYFNNYFYEQYESNDNCLVQMPMFDGLTFLGYVPVRGNWKGSV